jgi:hypothetical protein
MSYKKYDTGGRNHRLNVVLKRGGLILMSIVLYVAFAYMALSYILSPTISGGTILQ